MKGLHPAKYTKTRRTARLATPPGPYYSLHHHSILPLEPPLLHDPYGERCDDGSCHHRLSNGVLVTDLLTEHPIP